MLLVKLIVLVLLGFVVVSLFSGLFFLVRDKGQTNRTVNALGLRVGLSLLAVAVIVIAGIAGVIELNPNPLYEPESPPAATAPAATASDGVGAGTGSAGGGGRRPIGPDD